MKWTRATVRDELIKMFREHAQAGGEITEASHLVADLGIDSLGVAEVMAGIEDTFHLTIKDDMLQEIDTIADVVTSIEARLEADGRLEG